MAVKKCSDCGGNVSSSAKACPHCGAKVKRLGLVGWLLLSLVAFQVFGMIIGALFFQ